MIWLFDHAAPYGETGRIALWVGACYIVALGYRLTHWLLTRLWLPHCWRFDREARRFQATRAAREAATRGYRL